MDKGEGFLPEGLKLFNLRDTFKSIGRAVVRHLPESGYHSEREFRGAERALTEGLGYDKYRDSEDMNRWDDAGDYTERSL